MRERLRSIVPHLIILIGFVIVALVYFKPVLQGKGIFQSDIQQHKGMSRQKNEFKKEHQEETYWVDNAFGGMPTYLIGANYPNDYVKKIDRVLRFLPRPADYLFLYFLGLYLLFLVLKIDYKLAAVGALAFGFSTYLIIILGVGHNAKAHAIAYLPLVLAGIMAVFRKHYYWGGILLALALALEIYTGHFQITYYLLLSVLILGAAFLVDALRKGELPHFFKSIGIMLIALVLAMASNTTTLLASKEYTDFSTRGDTGLNLTKEGAPKEKAGLSYEYITEYSYGIAETMNLFIPRFTGGASTEKLDHNSHSYKALMDLGASPGQARQITQHSPTYWGKQPIVASPNYVGASVLFLFVLAFFLTKGRIKWWIAGSSLLALLLSWGDNFSSLTRFFINYVPLYSKFRTVAMIQVLIQFAVPFFGIYGLSKFFSPTTELKDKTRALKIATLITVGTGVFFLLVKTWIFDFSGPYDGQYAQNIAPDFIHALKQDRIAMFNYDTWRSILFVVLVAGILYLVTREKLQYKWGVVLLGGLILIDLVSVDLNYVNDEDFVTKMEIEKPFSANSADQEIDEDKSHFRVLDFSVNPMNSARTSFFHNSLGGYHAAKPGRMQELFDFHISEGNEEVVNMLNTKYFIVEGEEGIRAQLNPNANGNAWFVESIDFVDSADEEIQKLGEIDTRKTAVVDSKFKSLIPQTDFYDNAADEIQLTSYKPNHLVYDYELSQDRLAVFSEIYYPHGWQVEVDGKPVEMLQADYLLRAVYLPEGKHTLSFRFEPEIVRIGSGFTLASGIVLGILIIGGLWFEMRQSKGEKSTTN